MSSPRFLSYQEKFLSKHLKHLFFFFFFTAFGRSTNIFRRFFRVESSQLLASAGQQLLGAFNRAAMFGPGDLSFVLAGMERRQQKTPKLLKNCKQLERLISQHE